MSLQLTIPAGEGPQQPYPWAWCDMRCGDFVEMTGMPRNVCMLHGPVVLRMLCVARTSMNRAAELRNMCGTYMPVVQTSAALRT